MTDELLTGAAPEQRPDVLAPMSEAVQALRRALGSRSIVLVGMMGAGKSSIGRRLAGRTDRSPIVAYWYQVPGSRTEFADALRAAAPEDREAVVEAAGGIVTDWTGGPCHMGGRVLAAANPAIHAEALALLNG